jgi:BlaI family penicillinase repressor
MADSTPSPREMEILKALWELGPASVREVHERLCPGGELAFNTVQTLLRIMDEKGLVTHKNEGRTFVYSAAYSRERATARFLSDVFDGAVSDCVLTLLKTGRPREQELRDLEAMIAQARKRKSAD